MQICATDQSQAVLSGLTFEGTENQRVQNADSHETGVDDANIEKTVWTYRPVSNELSQQANVLTGR